MHDLRPGVGLRAGLWFRQVWGLSWGCWVCRGVGWAEAGGRYGAVASIGPAAMDVAVVGFETVAVVLT